MPSSTLFPLDREPLKPDPRRREPVLWLKRLVILSALDSSTIIRDIEFRRGLNIIKTRQMKTQGGPVAGHSVGKTLLMRLIRYTLGESDFGNEETEQNIAKMLRSAYVVGHWSVAGVDWIAIRPLRVADAEDSFAAVSANWRQVVDSPQREHTHREFVEAVSAAVLSDLPVFQLPRGREAKWLDVIAWLSRDYQCGYRKANEWRHEDANSGPSLDREENSLIMQWLMGLMSSEEIALRLQHQQLLDRRAEHKRVCEREQRRLETLWPALRDKLELTDDSIVVDDQITFNSIRPTAVVSDRIASLERLKADRLSTSGISQLESERDALLAKANDYEVAIRSCQAMVGFLTKQLRAYETDPLQLYAKCQADPCWLKERAKETAADPAADDHLADLRNQLDEQRNMLAHSQRSKSSHQASLEDTSLRVRAERQRLAGELSSIDVSIGRWKGYEPDAKTFQSAATTASSAAKALAKSESAVSTSQDVQGDVREKHRREIARLSGVYKHLLQRIFGAEAVGKIQVDGNGLQPVPDRKLAPAGAALSVMTTVLAFDIACVAASIGGVGGHPRFLLHDSPREGDMEAPLFRRLFEIVHELETEFENGDPVSFQYIVTTTTSPPEALGDDNGPYVRETLDARTDGGLLLRRRF